MAAGMYVESLSPSHQSHITDCCCGERHTADDRLHTSFTYTSTDTIVCMYERVDVSQVLAKTSSRKSVAVSVFLAIPFTGSSRNLLRPDV